jgi:hypothetical protein
MALRGIVLLIPYTIIIAHGMHLFILKIKKQKIGLAIIFGINWIVYLIIFTTRIASLNSNSWQMNQKNLIMNVSLLSSKTAVHIYGTEPEQAFIQYAFYKLTDPKIIKSNLQAKKYGYKNIIFSDKCPSTLDGIKGIFIMKKNYCSNIYQNYAAYTPAELKEQSILINTEYLKNIDMSSDDYILIKKS